METRNYTPEQVIEALREAAAAVEAAGLPEHLGRTGFEQACRLIASKRVEQALPGGLLLAPPPNARG